MKLQHKDNHLYEAVFTGLIDYKLNCLNATVMSSFGFVSCLIFVD